MKSYPSINTDVDFSCTYHVFDKLDGSNVRCEWVRKKGLVKFGSRHRLLDDGDEQLGHAVTLMRQVSDHIDRAMSKTKIQKAVWFFEYHGPNSFAGSHFDDPVDRRITLLDVAAERVGLLEVPDVTDLSELSGIPMPNLLHKGRVGVDFLDRVRQGSLPGVTFEGVIGKGPFLKT